MCDLRNYNSCFLVIVITRLDHQGPFQLTIDTSWNCHCLLSFWRNNLFPLLIQSYLSVSNIILVVIILIFWSRFEALKLLTRVPIFILFYSESHSTQQANHELNLVAMETTSLIWQNNCCQGNYFQIKILFSQYTCHIVQVIDTKNSSSHQAYNYEQLLKIYWSLMLLHVQMMIYLTRPLRQSLWTWHR